MTVAARWRRFAEGPEAGPRRVAKGVVLGLMASATATMVGLRLPRGLAPLTPVAHVVVGVVAMTGSARLRRAYWCLLGLLVALTIVIGGTPLAPACLARLEVDDGPVPADVIVVLSGSTKREGLNVYSRDRLLCGLKLLEAGVAPVMVCTGEPPNPLNQFDRLALEEMRDLGLDTTRLVPFEWPGWSGMNTHKEALAIAAMAERHGWHRLLVVTSASHTRRSRASFRRAGLDAWVTAARSSLVTERGSTTAAERYTIWHGLVYEAVALVVYRLRGWI